MRAVTAERSGARWQRVAEWVRGVRGQRIEPSIRPFVINGIVYFCDASWWLVVGSCCAHATVVQCLSSEWQWRCCRPLSPLLYYLSNVAMSFLLSVNARPPPFYLALLLCRGERDQVDGVSKRLLNSCQKVPRTRHLRTAAEIVLIAYRFLLSYQHIPILSNFICPAG